MRITTIRRRLTALTALPLAAALLAPVAAAADASSASDAELAAALPGSRLVRTPTVLVPPRRGVALPEQCPLA